MVERIDGGLGYSFIVVHIFFSPDEESKTHNRKYQFGPYTLSCPSWELCLPDSEAKGAEIHSQT